MDAAHDRRQLGQLMVEEGLLADEELEHALAEQSRTGRPLGKILVELGYVSSGAVANALAEQHGGLLKTEFGISAGLQRHHEEVAPEPDPAGQALALIEELEEQLDAAAAERERLLARIDELERAQEGDPEPQDGHLVVVPSPSGYSLFHSPGPAPAARTVFESTDGIRYAVARVGPSPLPNVRERCVYLERLSSSPSAPPEAEEGPAPGPDPAPAPA